jgi:hypothetical protein
MMRMLHNDADAGSCVAAKLGQRRVPAAHAGRGALKTKSVKIRQCGQSTSDEWQYDNCQYEKGMRWGEGQPAARLKWPAYR